ncbi:MAG: membrane protein of unknown function [Candidatus Thorarchaeota archaeon]|nr:MAG: membrane protein of unknown function [Candidatus Thorarchaeota archaeon]
MKLREDSEPYCILWLGILLLSAYFFNFLYLELANPGYVLARVSFLSWLLPAPLILIFTFVGYLKPERSRIKPTMLAVSVVIVTMMFITALIMPILEGSATFSDALFLTSWGTGAALFIAGGLSVMHSLDESTSLGTLEVDESDYSPQTTLEN